MSATLPDRVATAEEVIFQELADECVLLNMASEKYYGLDDVGARMWRLLVEHGETATVLQHLQAYYETDEATLQNDLATLIEELQAEGLVRAVN